MFRGLVSVLVLILLSHVCFCRSAASKKPNIVLIVADDYGFNDVGYHNPDMMTPNLDKVGDHNEEMTLHIIVYFVTQPRSHVVYDG